MDSPKFKDWFNKLGQSWTERDPLRAANLFSKDVQYYESAFNSPCENWKKVLDLWKSVPINQKDITFNFEIILTKGNLAIANWTVSRTLLPANKKQMINGIFIIRLNKDNLCNYFKQWRTVKEI